MKGKRFLAWAMTVVLTISLLTVTAGAVTFSDMTNHWGQDRCGISGNSGCG